MKKKRIISKADSKAMSHSQIDAIADLIGMAKVQVRLPDDFEELPEANVDIGLYDDDFDLQSIIDNEIKNFSPIPRDMKIDDSSMPLAPNFYDFCTGESFLNSPPYLEQALIGVRFFGDYCVHCSDNEWMSDDGHEADEGLPMFESKVCLLQNGTCPKCGARKVEMYKSGELNFYNELAVNAGQRCVTGDTIVYTRNGLEYIGDIGKNKPYGFSTYKQDVFNGDEFETTSDFYRGKSERLYGVKLSNNFMLRGTADHPIWTLGGFKTLSALNTSDVIPVYVGQEAWGNKTLTLGDIRVEAQRMWSDKYSSTSNKHLLKALPLKADNIELCKDLYTVLGLWVAEGRGNVISNDDGFVLDFCEATLSKYINKRYIKRGNQDIRLLGYGSSCFLAALLGCEVSDLYSGSASKYIPPIVMSGTRENACAFLKGLYEGDGSTGSGTKRKIGGVGYGSLSRRLVMEIYSLFINLGMLPCLRERATWATNGSDAQVSKSFYCLTIKGEFTNQFVSDIGMLSPRKQNRLLATANRRTSGNLVPNKFENLSFLKDYVYGIFKKFDDELKMFKNKQGQPMGLFTIFGRKGNSELGARWDKIFKENRALTKQRIHDMCLTCLSYSSFMSDSTKNNIETLLKYTDKNVYLVQIKKCGILNCSAETYDFTLPKTHKFITQGILSHNSGKSAVTTMIAAYILHMYLKLGKPNDLLGIRPNEVLHGTFLALTLGQARENLWDPFYGYITESPWFKNYHRLLRHYEKLYGEQLFSIKEMFVRYRHRNMLWYPATPDQRTLRGRTRIFAAIDELGWFDNNRDTKKVKDNAHGVYTAASNSLATARQAERRLIKMDFDRPVTGYMVNVSSPSSIRDKICELVRLSIGSKKLLGLHKPTWKMNPNLPFDSDIIQEYFRRDPIAAKRDLGAEPSLSAHPFIANTQFILNAIREKGRNWIKYRLKIEIFGKGKLAKRYRTAEINAVQSQNKNPSVMALDAGLTNNSFAVTIGSIHNDIPHIDLIIEVQPLPGIPISYTLLYTDVILPLIEQRNVRVLLADRWNSVKLLEDALRQCPDQLKVAKQYSLKYTDMIATRDDIEMKNLMIPIPETYPCTIEQLIDHNPDDYPKCFEGRPVDHFIVQMATIQDMMKKGVGKGDGFTDDIWRSAALTHWGLRNPDFAEHLIPAPASAAKSQPLIAHMGKLSRIAGGTSAGGTSASIMSSSGSYLGYRKSLK